MPGLSAPSVASLLCATAGRVRPETHLPFCPRRAFISPPSEPRHWQEKGGWFGPKAWLVGQAVALREISEQLKQKADPDLQVQQNALLWLLRLVPDVQFPDDRAGKEDFIGAWSNQVAQTIS